MADIKALVNQFIAAFNAHDLDAIDKLTSPDCEIEASTGIKMRGLPASRDWNKRWFDGFPDVRITLTNLVVSGNTSVTEALFEGTNSGTFRTQMGDIPATGKRVRGPFVNVTEYDDGGLAKKGRLYFDNADLMVQLGLIPAPAGAER